MGIQNLQKFEIPQHRVLKFENKFPKLQIRVKKKKKKTPSKSQCHMLNF